MSIEEIRHLARSLRLYRDRLANAVATAIVFDDDLVKLPIRDAAEAAFCIGQVADCLAPRDAR